MYYRIALMEQARYLGNGLYAYDVRHMGTIKQHASVQHRLMG